VHFVPVLSDVVDGVWFFSAALVGPIANLNAAPFSESNADANCGIAIANASHQSQHMAAHDVHDVSPAEMAVWRSEL
jgi:hypothetical protein